MTLYCINPSLAARSDPIGYALRSIVFLVDARMPPSFDQLLEKLG